MLQIINEVRENLKSLSLPPLKNIYFIHENQIEKWINNSPCACLTWQGEYLRSKDVYEQNFTLHLLIKNANSQNNIEALGIELSEYIDKIKERLDGLVIKFFGEITYQGSNLNSIISQNNSTYFILDMRFKIVIINC